MTAQLTAAQRRWALESAIPALTTIGERKAQRLFYCLFPDEDSPAPPAMHGYFPTGVIHARQKYQRHLEFFEAGEKYRERCFMAANRVGKALKDGTPVATPDGWRAIETLKVGDTVYAGDGTPTRVTGVYPQGIKPLYRLTFDGAYEIECCAEHLWYYQKPRARYPYRQSHGEREENPFYGEWDVSTTQEILDAVGPAPISRMRVVMPTTKPWQMEARTLPLRPYLLGVLLGDGCLHKALVSVSSADDEIIEAVKADLPDGATIRYLGRYDYRINRVGTGPHPVMQALREVGLHNKRSGEKFVPEDYKLSCLDDRLAVLQGLMDTDGSISATGAMEFTSVSRRLVDDVVFLVTSLGGRATIESRQTSCNGKPGAPSWRAKIRINICPFRLPRKAERWNPRRNTADRVLHRIEESEPARATCISVAHPDRTYVTAHGIVTHNTFSAGGFEMACHLTGEYPDWWPGRRFNRPIRAWAAGKWNETTRDIVQATLLGQIAFRSGRKTMDGTGVIPGHAIGAITWKQGITDLVDTVRVRHVSGGWSTLGLKSYQQGRGSFEGTSQHVIWLDEECPLDVYGECLIRTATTNGLVMLTFTPLEGMSETVLQFLPDDMRPGI